MKLLLQSEVAERLDCSASTVKNLRRDGRLAFIPGRPVLIAETDLEAYEASMAAEKAEVEMRRAKTRQLHDSIRIRLSLGRS